MHTFFSNQIYILTKGLNPSDQRANDIRTGEFANAVTDFWSEHARNRRFRTRNNLKKWLNLRPTSVRISTARQSPARQS